MPLTQVKFEAPNETELNSFMLDEQYQFPVYWKQFTNKKTSFEFWTKVIGQDAARVRVQEFHSILKAFRPIVKKENKSQATSVKRSVNEKDKHEAKSNCSDNILPLKRKDNSYDTNERDVPNALNPRDSKSIRYSKDINYYDGAKNDNNNVEDVGKTEGENNVGIDGEANVEEVDTEECDAEANRELFDHVLSFDSSSVSDEHTDQDDANNTSCSLNNNDRSSSDAERHIERGTPDDDEIEHTDQDDASNTSDAERHIERGTADASNTSDAVRHFNLDYLNVERGTPHDDEIEVDESIFLRQVGQFNFNGVNAQEDALVFQYEMAKVILLVRESTFLKDYYVYLIFLRCIEREKEKIIVEGWNSFFGRFNKFVRSTVVSFLKAAMVVWVLQGNDADNLQSLQQIINKCRQAHRIDFETFEVDTPANRVYRKNLCSRVSEHAYLINLLAIVIALVHLLGCSSTMAYKIESRYL